MEKSTTGGYPGRNNRLSTVHRSPLAISGQIALIVGGISRVHDVERLLHLPRSSTKVEELETFRDNYVNCSAIRFTHTYIIREEFRV